MSNRYSLVYAQAPPFQNILDELAPIPPATRNVTKAERSDLLDKIDEFLLYASPHSSHPIYRTGSPNCTTPYIHHPFTSPHSIPLT